jgi:hypothetical protein
MFMGVDPVRKPG